MRYYTNVHRYEKRTPREKKVKPETTTKMTDRTGREREFLKEEVIDRKDSRTTAAVENIKSVGRSNPRPASTSPHRQYTLAQKRK